MVTANGNPVVEGLLSLPRVGAWYADLIVQSSDPISGAVDIGIEGVATFKGTVVRGGSWLETQWVRVSSGAGGASKTARGQHYTSTTVRAVAGDVVSAGGETLASTSDAAVLGARLPAYTLLNQPVGAALSALLDVRGTDRVWRYLPDGTIWIARETWPDSGLVNLTDYQDLSEQPQQAEAILGFELPGRLLPGTTLDGRRVSLVEYKWDGEKVRARVLFED